MKVTLLIPTLNEVEGLKQIMPRIKREWVDQIIIVDGVARTFLKFLGRYLSGVKKYYIPRARRVLGR